MSNEAGSAPEYVGAGAVWSVGVLCSGAENTRPLDAGTAGSIRAAWAAATAATVRAVGDWGRAEYRLTVAGVPVMVIPGLTAGGRVDVEDVHGGLDELAALHTHRLTEHP